MPEQLLASSAAGPEHDGQGQKPGCLEALDLTALRALRQSRTDVEALDVTAERLRHLEDEDPVRGRRAHQLRTAGRRGEW
ncbi:hypothetical protein SUDANB178_07781 (plasmid) [Streptomyces sp. enrichment culture]